MTRWIVNPRTHEVRAAPIGIVGGVEYPQVTGMADGEFVFDAPTSADAAMAGRRHNLAVEALESLPEERSADPFFKVLGDRIVWNMADTSSALSELADLHNMLEARGFEVWREGLALLVLARRWSVVENSGSAWVDEIGSDR